MGLEEAALLKVNRIDGYKTVAAVTNEYTLDLSTDYNFAIETEDANAKEIVISNVPSTANLIVQVSVKLTYTNAAAITHTLNGGTVAWKDATTPTFVAGKKYILLYTSYDAGTTWLGASVGAWA